jgi:adenylate cyclase
VGREIERKFLVRGEGWRAAARGGTPFQQGYLSTSKDSTVRVRLAGDEAWLTVKGKTLGASRDEFEYAIPPEDARQMLDTLCPDRVVKTRYVVPHEGHDWEVDVFEAGNAGLVVAEIELDDESEAFARPDWLGEEVTDDHRYANANLARAPWSSWGRGGGAPS